MQFLTLAVPLALAGVALAGPLEARGVCTSNACAAAITGKAALGDDKLRGSHCASFLVTTVTPPAVTSTVTITGFPGEKTYSKRAIVTVCPNEVPNYASACDLAAYSSACSCFGFNEVKTTTIAPRTTTDTVYVAPTCPTVATTTVTATTTTTTTSVSTTTSVTTETTTSVSTTTTTETTTTTVTAEAPTDTTCLTDEEAETLASNFLNFLTNTNKVTDYAKNVLGLSPKGFNLDLAAATLADNFTDVSDSINFMAGRPLGSVSFPNAAAFTGTFGQSNLAQVDGQTLNVWHGCKDVTWRWRIVPQLPTTWPVVGISHFTVNSEKKIEKYFTEFNNGAWLQDFGQSCAVFNTSDSGAIQKRKRHADFDLLRHVEA